VAQGLNIVHLLADLNAFSAGGLSTRLEVKADDGTVVETGGEIVDQNGNHAGTVSRSYVRREGNWEARHTGLYLDEPFQQRGFGRAFQRASEVTYRKHGIGQVSLFAQGTGAYAWHSEGFQLAGPPERRCQQCLDIWRKWGGRERAHDALQAGHVTQAEFGAADEEFSRVERGDRASMEPGDIAAIGANKRWKDTGGREMWLGRVILTDSRWTGVKQL